MTKNNEEIPQVGLIHLSSANIDRQGVYLLDTYDRMYFYVGSAVSDQFCQDVLEVPNFTSIPEGMVSCLHAFFFLIIQSILSRIDMYCVIWIYVYKYYSSDSDAANRRPCRT